MDIFDLLLGPGQRQEQERIRRLAKQVSKDPAQDRDRAGLARRAVSETGFLGLAVLTLEQLLVEKGVITRQEFAERLRRLDEIDGVRDGQIDQRTLMSALGFRTAPDPDIGAVPAPARGVVRGIPVARAVVPSGRPGQPGIPAPARRDSSTALSPGARPGAGPAVKPAAPERAVPGANPRSVIAPPPEPKPAPPASGAAAAAAAAAEVEPLDTSALGQTSFEDYFGKDTPAGG